MKLLRSLLLVTALICLALSPAGYSQGNSVNNQEPLTPTDYVSQLREKAEQSNADAQNNLGVCYEYGHGVPQDYGQAVSWWLKSAAQGNDTAKNNLKRHGFSD